MRRVEQELAHWQRLYEELQQVRLRLNATAPGPQRATLEAEVRRLEREGDAALDSIHAAFEAIKDSPEAL